MVIVVKRLAVVVIVVIVVVVLLAGVLAIKFFIDIFRMYDRHTCFPTRLPLLLKDNIQKQQFEIGIYIVNRCFAWMTANFFKKLHL